MAFKKILVAEDYDDSKTGLIHLLENLKISRFEVVQYCDQAYIEVGKALQEKLPFELLITDLSFTPAFGRNNIATGQELIDKIKGLQPQIKVIVFSQEDSQFVIKSLFKNQNIDGYVCKGLFGSKELTNAISTVYKGEKFTCPVSTAVLEQQHTHQLSNYEKQLLKLLVQGYKQNQIQSYFQQNKILPNSRRAIEDRISKLKEVFEAKTNPQLVYLVTTLGLI